MLSSITSTVGRKVNVTKLFSTMTKLVTINFGALHKLSPLAVVQPARVRTECQVRDLGMTESVSNIKKSPALQDTFGTQMVDIYVGPLWQHCLVHEKFFWSALDRGEPSKTPELAVKTLALDEECLTLPKKAYKTTGIPEEHRKCVVADKGDRQMTTEGYELFKRWLRACGDPGKSPLPFRVVGNAVLARYFTSYLTACDGRRFFSTVEGGISLGPLGITPGDDVCVLLNGPIPFIFRQKEAKDNFEHVGHAYVYGITYGEALEKHSNEE